MNDDGLIPIYLVDAKSTNEKDELDSVEVSAAAETENNSANKKKTTSRTRLASPWVSSEPFDVARPSAVPSYLQSSTPNKLKPGRGIRLSSF